MKSGALLSKSRFVAGMQCPKLLYWRTHEPDAAELVPSESLQGFLDQGKLVEERARTLFPSGVLIPEEDEGRVEATRTAIEGGAKVLFEAAFLADDVFVAVDVLVRDPDGDTWTIVEIKSRTSVKPHYIDDVAVQAHVVERSGLSVRRVEIMHLDADARTTKLEGIFKRVDVTNEVTERRKTLEDDLRRQLTVIQGELPVIEVGPHCFTPYRCPFRNRCWPPREERAEVFEVDEAGLRSAMSGWLSPIAFLDFETMGPPFPIWEGYAPYEVIPLQLSAHVEANGDHVHHAWIIDSDSDPRRRFAEALLEACAGAHTILAYNASYERNIILRVADYLPDLAPCLRDLAYRTCDMLAPVRQHVTHPDFEGSYSLKRVLPVLTGLGYDDLAIDNGLVASQALEKIARGEADPNEQRDALLAYCARDTWGLVVLLKRLRELARV